MARSRDVRRGGTRTFKIGAVRAWRERDAVRSELSDTTKANISNHRFDRNLSFMISYRQPIKKGCCPLYWIAVKEYYEKDKL
jgi:hypothetical protein